MKLISLLTVGLANLGIVIFGGCRSVGLRVGFAVDIWEADFLNEFFEFRKFKC
jgi:hypothetical protein